MITLQETETEYLLTIPPWLKQRAKSIAGRAWDPERRCWVFPRSTESYLALIAEFEGEIRGQQPGPPMGISISDVVSPVIPHSKDESDLHPTVEELDAVRDEIEDYKRSLSDARGRVAESTREIDSKNAEIVRLTQKIANVELSNQSLSVELDSLRAELLCTKKIPTAAAPPTDFVSIAFEASANNEDFLKLLRNRPLDDSFPVVLGKALESRLREILGASTEVRFVDLITDADRSGILSKDAVGFAHAIRRARNAAVHSSEFSEGAGRALALHSLFSGALLWRELSARSDRK